MDGSKELTESEQVLYDNLTTEINEMALDLEQAEEVIGMLDELIGKLLEGCIR